MKIINSPELYMQRCLTLAKCGSGHVSPNPLVGCVIVHKEKIIGEGYHKEFGGPHAEVNAINSVKDKSHLSDSTLYVNLEPCAHFGKTPPCSDLIVSSKIPHVVIGTTDPFSKVSGKGIEKMEEAGVKVDVGLMEEESREINKRFFTFHNRKRPYIILKWAETVDGFIDRDRSKVISKPTWITSDACKIAVHKQRADEDAVMVGTNTAERDNPSLSVRYWTGHNPLRLVLDRQHRLPSELHLFDYVHPTLVFTKDAKKNVKNLEYFEVDFEDYLHEDILDELYERNIMSVIIEGGTRLLKGFISKGLWDEAWRFIGNKSFTSGIDAPRLTGELVGREKMSDSILLVFKNKKQ
ncbi:bifunctional diaminohydroxyphosphoribosylaminopyrimidine deaminase/5-amino-6-(5-phosphoribosylamino)uracil reductase RibD [Saccharicrinis sp. FJH54]|uniref:bifunctional diaminohydroxyphosphoribosylaminopyrimidine deaminase/5-amino-6-(5-phosphoribosylamino)uracil reductase RibD n=1 Tax=Saccharicrinis sp. FJH54 TaxID=3344665 RepID=UPI0035D4FF16